jgi:hypothetical protein
MAPSYLSFIAAAVFSSNDFEYLSGIVLTLKNLEWFRPGCAFPIALVIIVHCVRIVVVVVILFLVIVNFVAARIDVLPFAAIATIRLAEFVARLSTETLSSFLPRGSCCHYCTPFVKKFRRFVASLASAHHPTQNPSGRCVRQIAAGAVAEVVQKEGCPANDGCLVLSRDLQ